MEKFLSNKKVLFIGYEYYNYHTHIKNSILQAGASLTYYPNVKNKLVYFILRKISFFLFQKYCHNYGKKILKETKGIDFDYFLIIHGFQFDDYFYENLKKQNKNAKLVNYTWDSIRPTYHKNTILDILPHFHKAFSFDSSDCKKFNKQEYLPLFYIDTYAQKKEYISNPKYDIVFIGSLATLNRYFHVREIEKICKAQNIKFYYYLRIGMKQYLTFLLKGVAIKNAKFKSLNQTEIKKIYDQTNVIVDMPGQLQSGLTMRTIETLGYGLKLITTNELIKNEELYNSDYIDVISINDIKIDKEFISKKPSSALNTDKYSIHSWLKKLLINV